jgi:hypothetical protein
LQDFLGHANDVRVAYDLLDESTRRRSSSAWGSSTCRSRYQHLAGPTRSQLRLKDPRSGTDHGSAPGAPLARAKPRSTAGWHHCHCGHRPQR